MTAATQERCDNCGGTMGWDGAARRLKCGSCGNLRDVAVAGAVSDHDLLDALASGKARGQLGDAQARTVKCQECGAEVLFPDGATATRCSFCDSPSVLAQDPRGDRLRPESLIPFAVGREQAVAAFKTWLGKRWFRPSNLTDQASVSELRGVYVPYWTFSVHVQSHWTADAGYYYDEREDYTDGSGERKTRSVRKTRWQPAHGVRDDDYRDHLVCASKGLPDQLEHRASAFTTDGLLPWAPQYLAGFVAESYAVDLRDAWSRGQSEIGAAQEGRCRHDVPGDTQRDLRASHRFEDPAFKHVLLPMWIAAFRYQTKVYRFLVNGQSGAVAGEAPRSWTKILIFIAALTCAVVALILLLHGRAPR